MKALIRFFFKENPDEMDIDTFVKRECEIRWLIKREIIPMAQVPLKLS